MKCSINISGMVAALMLSACSGGNSGSQDCWLLCFQGPAEPPPPGTVTVYASSDSPVTEGDTVWLSGDAVHSRHRGVSYSWNQTSGPSVTIANDYSIIGTYARFVAPAVTTVTTLTFRLRAFGDDGATNSVLVDVLVQPTSASALCLQAPLFAISYAWANADCTTNSADIDDDSRIATVYRQGEAEPNDSMQSANPLTFSTRIATERIATDVAGSISGVDNDNDDFFVFTPPETGTYEVYVCNDPLVCIRGTKTDKWFLSLSDQNFEVIAGTTAALSEQVMSQVLQAGLPYYVGIHVWEADMPSWDYNLTIISRSD